MALTETRLDKILGIGSGTGSRPAAGQNGARWIDTTGPTETYDNGSAWVTLGGAVSLTSSTNQLSSAVTMTSTNTFYDGPSLSLAAGTWLLLASIYIAPGTATGDVTAKLWDGSAAFASAFATPGGTNLAIQMALSAVVSPGTTTTYKVSAARDGGTGTWTIGAAAGANGAGNNASTLVAIKIA
jgi:hypothetical protein